MRTSHMLLPLGAALIWAVSHARAATPDAKLAYQQARDAAGASYKNARAQCDALAGNPKDVCVAEAKAARVRAEEEARARYEDTLRAYTRARMRATKPATTSSMPPTAWPASVAMLSPAPRRTSA